MRPTPHPDDRSNRGPYLAPLGTRRWADEWGYTDIPVGAAKIEPQPLTDEEHKMHIAGGAMFRDRQLKQVQLTQIQQARAGLSLEQRLIEVQRVAKMRHINVKGEVAALCYSLSRARAGGRKDPSSVVWGVERLEGRLDAKYLPDAA